jgi:WD40 repeat protein
MWPALPRSSTLPWPLSRLSPLLPGVPMAWASAIGKSQSVTDGRSTGPAELELLSCRCQQHDSVYLQLGGVMTLGAVTGSHDGTVRLWDPLTGSALGAPLTGHTAASNRRVLPPRWRWSNARLT